MCTPHWPPTRGIRRLITMTFNGRPTDDRTAYEVYALKTLGAR